MKTDEHLTGEITRAFLRITEAFMKGRPEVSGDLYKVEISDVIGCQKFKFAGNEYIIKTTKYIMEEAIKFETFEKINNYPVGKDTYKIIDDLTIAAKPDPKKRDLFIMSFNNDTSFNSNLIGTSYYSRFITLLADNEAEIIGPYFVDVSNF